MFSFRFPPLHQLQLWDTAGQERFRKSMVQHYYRNVHAVLFLYDVSCPASFNSLASWIEEFRQHSLGQEIPRYLHHVLLLPEKTRDVNVIIDDEMYSCLHYREPF